MKTQYTMTISLCFLMLATMLNGCSNKEQVVAPEPQSAEQVAMEAAAPPPEPTQLPVRYQTPGYIVAPVAEDDETGLAEEEYAFKVGANITSTKGPQPLWDIVKRLGNLKGMSVSWASDVDQEVKVDVNIRANDNYFEALDNLLRQVDYFHEVDGNTIVIKYKETKQFQIAIPYIKGNYKTNVGGDFLPQDDTSTGNTKGTAQIESEENSFDVWANIKKNIEKILLLEATATSDSDNDPIQNADTDNTADQVPLATHRSSSEEPYYFIDNSTGLITVSAPRSLIMKIQGYIVRLKRALYRQVVIEAKIIEVYLKDNSRIGLDWSQVLKNFDIGGVVRFGGSPNNSNDGQVYPWNSAIDSNQTDSEGNITHYGTGDPFTRFISKISISPVNFTVLLNALNEQGSAHVLSNPKITVLNGQPAVISVAKNITYIKKVTRDIQNSNGSSIQSYTPEPGQISEGVALGVLATILDDNNVILHLTPITTDLANDQIPERIFPDGTIIGLPVVNVREMSTMVKVKNGEMLIIGGLIDSVQAKTGDFAPVLGDIPIIRYLFGVEEKRMEKRELVILLTPRVI